MANLESILVLALLVILSQSSPIGAQNQTSEELQCLFKACQLASGHLRQSIDLSANKCDHHYQFSCGNWPNNNTELVDMKENSVHTRMLQRLGNLMNSFQELGDNQTERRNRQSIMEQYTIELYQECVDRVTAQICATELSPSTEATVYKLQQQEQEQGPICTETVCLELAAEIRGSLNPTVDPCVDFFEYSCGRWSEQYPMPDHKSRFGVSDVMEQQINQLIYRAINRTKSNSNAVQYAQHIFNQCVQYDYQPTEGDRLVEELVTSVVGNWTIGETTKPNNPKIMWYQYFVKSLVFGGISPLFWVSIIPDPTNVTVNMILLDSVTFTLSDEELQEPEQNIGMINAFKGLIEKSVRLFGAKELKNQTLLRSQIDDIVQLESKLAKAKTDQDRDPRTWYRKMTIQEMSEITNFDWLGLVINPVLNELQTQVGVSELVSNTTLIVVTDIEYLAKTIQIMDQLDPMTRQNYFGWKLVEEYGDYASRNIRQYEFEFKQMRTGVRKPKVLWKSCLALFHNDFSFAWSRLFVEQNFHPAEKEEALKLIHEIQESFSILLEANQWIDPITKARSLDKLAKVRINAGYPEWLLNDTQLDKFYGLSEDEELTKQLMNDTNFLKSFAKFSVNEKRNEFDRLLRPVNLEMEWPMSPASVNAVYEPEQNSITIPAGILKKPNFHYHYPASVNFGAIGVAVGHEFSHGLDDQGRHFDSIGSLHNWWTKESIVNFENRSECFVRQYSRILDRTVDLRLNGQSTLGENIADNAGLREAFYAFKHYERKNFPAKKLPNLTEFSSDQLFFISYAQSWCGTIRPESLFLQIEYDPHAPNQFRVNVPVSNSIEFAKAFQCRVAAPMNPAKKCLLW